MTIYALDTNIVSYILKGNADVIGRYKAETQKGNSIILPPIVVFEIIRGLKAIGAEKRLKAFEDFCADIDIGIIDLPVWYKAADIHANLRKLGKPGSDADILIAAFCVLNDYVLVTNNTKDFENISGLRLDDWK